MEQNFDQNIIFIHILENQMVYDKIVS